MNQRKYYLRIFDRFFRDETAQRFEDSPHRYAMYVLYQKMLLRSARFDGKIMYRGVYADIEEQLAKDFDETKDMMQTVLSYFVTLGIVVKHERYIYFPDAAQLLGSEWQSAERMRALRKRRKENQLKSHKMTQKLKESHKVTKAESRPESQSDKKVKSESQSDQASNLESQGDKSTSHKVTRTGSRPESQSDGCEFQMPDNRIELESQKPHYNKDIEDE